MMTPPPSHRRTDAVISPGSRPAAIPLVPAHKFGPWSHRKSCGATRHPLVHTSTHAQASSQGNRIADL
jgi:hypothetical protein